MASRDPKGAAKLMSTEIFMFVVGDERRTAVSRAEPFF